MSKFRCENTSVTLDAPISCCPCGCQYSVYPADWKPDTTYRPAAKAAKEYPFTLDPFQKQAIQYIERNESMLVSAHTSAGKVGTGHRAQGYN